MTKSDLLKTTAISNVGGPSSDPKVATPVETTPPTPVPSSTDIFNDLDALREQSKLTVRRRSMLTNVFVVKHPDSGKHFRIHPDEGMTLNATVIFDDNRNCYFVTPGMRNHPKLIKRLRYVVLHLAVLWPDQQPVLWPVPIINEGNDFPVWRSYRKAAELGKESWMQMQWDEMRRDFVIEPAENIPHLPQWPKEGFSELLKIAFEGRIIDNEDHAYVHILRGLAD